MKRPPVGTILFALGGLLLIEVLARLIRIIWPNP